MRTSTTERTLRPVVDRVDSGAMDSAMKDIDDIAMTVECLISLEIEGLPTNESSFRRFLKREGWPVVYTENGKYLVLVEAVPEPFHSQIQQALLVASSAHEPIFPPEPQLTPRGWPLNLRVVVEARLTVVFEVTRRFYQIGSWNAAQGFADDANHFALSTHLQQAAIYAVDRSKSTTEFLLQQLRKKTADTASSGTSEQSRCRSGQIYSVISRTTIIRLVKAFSERGVYELFPGMHAPSKRRR